MSEERKKRLTEADRQVMLSHSPKVIPDNPTAKNWSAEKIKHYQWKPSDILFDYIGLIDTALYNYQVENDETFAGLNETISNINVNTGTFDPTSDNPASQKSIAGEMDELLNKANSAIFEITSEQASKLTEGFDITDEQYQFIITNKSVDCLIKVQDTNFEFPVAFTRVILDDQITAYFSLGIYLALSFSSDDVNPETNKHRLKLELNMNDFHSNWYISENEQYFDINGGIYSTFFDTINGTNILHEHGYETKDWQLTEDKTISIFGKHSILVPKDSADTSILPCTADDNGKVLSVVNGEAQWASAGGSDVTVTFED